MEDEYIERVIKTVRETSGDILAKKIDLTNIMDIVVVVMETVERLPAITGADKKRIAIKVIAKLAEEFSGIDGLDKIIGTLLSPIIDKLIEASKGKIHVNDLRSKVDKITNKLCCAN